MILASIEGTIIAVVIAAVMVLIRWVSDRSTRRTDADMRKSAEIRRAESSSKPESEEERMRRFLEALGIPADSAEAHRPATPPPLRPQPVQQREPSIKPIPPIVSGKSYPQPQPSRRVPPPQKRPVQVPAKAKRVEPPSLDEAPAPAKPVAQIELPELRTPEVEGFQTISSKVSAVMEIGAEPERSTPSGSRETHPAGARKPELWREALRTPEALRSAFIIKEILGPPRGLQNDPAAPSFPSL